MTEIVPYQMTEIVPYQQKMLPQVVAVWNAALGGGFPLRETVFVQNATGSAHFDPDGLSVAVAPAQRVVGMSLAKVAREPIAADGWLSDRGWISLIAVHPSFQGRGVGRALLCRAEAFLRMRSRHRSILGGDPGHFLPGVPHDAGALGFFAAAGYEFEGEAYDLRRSVAGYATPAAVTRAVHAHPDLEIRPLRAGEEGQLLAFLDETFPGRWRYTVGRYLQAGGAIADVMGVVRGRAVLGFAHLFHPASRLIGPSMMWASNGADLIGGLGPMGLAPTLRGRGLGLALLDRSIQRLRALGVREIIVDWTGLTGFYGRLGFSTWKRYRHGEKVLR